MKFQNKKEIKISSHFHTVCFTHYKIKYPASRVAFDRNDVFAKKYFFNN